ncbi:MAG: hypothetical protein GX640_02855, partial [Fibrobacter sp.]|nr:hypothetical protein [Fibrobacter sp.]
NNGDSVWINPIASISDGAGNIQQNPLNRRVILDVSKYDNALTVNDAFYYDANADGYIDSIVINISGNLEEISPNELLTMISFPQERSFSVESSVLSGNLLLLRVTQQNGQINTAVTDNDVLTVSWGIVAGKNLIKSGVVTIKDRVAPVILSAHLIDHETGNDTLYIRFSERIMNFNTVGPFRFRKNGGDEYYASLTLLSLDDGGRYIGRVNSSTEPLAIGDSVWISPSANITDIPGNIQQNPQNRRVQMTADLTGFPVMISEAIYFDDNADGFIDKIILRYTGILNFANLDIVTGAILLPPARNLSIENVNIIDSSIVLIVREGNLVPQTAVTKADRIVVSSRDLGEDGILMAGTVIATDSMAPVLISAQLEWYGPDRNTLNVTFSEPVNTVYSLSPFIFRKPEGGQYSVSLRNPTQTSGNRFSGQVVSVSNGYQLGTEDSLWINAVEQVHDLNHCYQDNPRNRRIPLTTNYHFTMRFLAENNPFQEGKRPIPAIVSETYTTNSLPVPDDGLIIIVEPDRKLNTEIPFEATISIYDVVQNPVILKKKMVLDRQRNRLYYIWNGANYNGRKVGSGTYSAVIKVKGNGTTVTKILRVGVKR